MDEFQYSFLAELDNLLPLMRHCAGGAAKLGEQFVLGHQQEVKELRRIISRRKDIKEGIITFKDLWR